ncbi:hypothetical protein D3C72_1629900 [compost metagenome]
MDDQVGQFIDNFEARNRRCRQRDMLSLRVTIDPDTIWHRPDIRVITADDYWPEVLIGDRPCTADGTLPRRPAVGSLGL